VRLSRSEAEGIGVRLLLWVQGVGETEAVNVETGSQNHLEKHVKQDSNHCKWNFEMIKSNLSYALFN
jgi:hypothetical protein